MKITKEFKVGLVMVIAIALFVYGFNFLKGSNFFNKQTRLYALYERVDGLIEANPLLLNGFKIGQVQDIKLVSDGSGSNNYRVLVTFLLNEEVNIPKGSLAKVISSDILGSKAVQIELSDQKEMIVSGDTLMASSEDDLKTTVDKRIAPLQKKAESLISSIDSVMQVVQQVLNKNVRENLIQSFESIKNAIISLEHTTIKVDTLISQEQYTIANIVTKVNSIITNIEKNNEKINLVIQNFHNISDSLARANIKQTIDNTNMALTQANLILNQINNGQGTLGKLVKNDSLYNNLNKSAAALDKLLVDLEMNPKRYVHFSVFGRSGKPKTIKQ